MLKQALEQEAMLKGMRERERRTYLRRLAEGSSEDESGDEEDADGVADAGAGMQGMGRHSGMPTANPNQPPSALTLDNLTLHDSAADQQEDAPPVKDDLDWEADLSDSEDEQ